MVRKHLRALVKRTKNWLEDPIPAAAAPKEEFLATQGRCKQLEAECAAHEERVKVLEADCTRLAARFQQAAESGAGMACLLREVLQHPEIDNWKVPVIGGTWKEPMRNQITRALKPWPGVV